MKGNVTKGDSQSDLKSSVIYRYMQTCLKYPFINSDAELSFLVNKLMNRRLTMLGRASILTFDTIRNPFILNNFCIKSPQKTWKISNDVELLPCCHDEKQSGIYDFLPTYFSVMYYQWVLACCPHNKHIVTNFKAKFQNAELLHDPWPCQLCQRTWGYSGEDLRCDAAASAKIFSGRLNTWGNQDRLRQWARCYHWFWWMEGLSPICGRCWC